MTTSSLLDRLDAQAEDATAKTDTAWRTYRKILHREIAGKSGNGDAAELAQVLLELELPKEQVAKDLDVLKDVARWWLQSVPEREANRERMSELQERIGRLRKTLDELEMQLGGCQGSIHGFSQQWVSLMMKCRNSPHMVTCEASVGPLPIFGSLDELTKPFRQNGKSEEDT